MLTSHDLNATPAPVQGVAFAVHDTVKAALLSGEDVTDVGLPALTSMLPVVLTAGLFIVAHEHTSVTANVHEPAVRPVAVHALVARTFIFKHDVTCDTIAEGDVLEMENEENVHAGELNAHAVPAVHEMTIFVSGAVMSTTDVTAVGAAAGFAVLKTEEVTLPDDKYAKEHDWLMVKE